MRRSRRLEPRCWCKSLRPTGASPRHPCHRVRFLEVKGRVAGAQTVTITKNEILMGLNKPEDFILALVTVNGDHAEPRYVRRAFQREPDFSVTSVNYKLADLLIRAAPPS